MARQLAITKRTKLDMYEGWGDCYVDWRPSTYADNLVLKQTDADGMDEEAAMNVVLKMTKDHIVGGKVKVIEAGEVQLVDLEADDVDNMPSDMVDRIFADITGVQYEDPKGLTTPEQPSEPQDSTGTTETPSSEA